MKIYNAGTKSIEETQPVEKTEEQWRQLLTPDQYRVTRQHGTEHPFTGEYADNKKKGMYQCIGCGLDLFDSGAKFDSGTGWPSFFQPIHENNVETKEDRSLFMQRVEVHCPRCQAHLGHVFEDGPAPTGLRYCINSVSLNFKPGT